MIGNHLPKPRCIVELGRHHWGWHLHYLAITQMLAAKPHFQGEIVYKSLDPLKETPLHLRSPTCIRRKQTWNMLCVHLSTTLRTAIFGFHMELLGGNKPTVAILQFGRVASKFSSCIVKVSWSRRITSSCKWKWAIGHFSFSVRAFSQCQECIGTWDMTLQFYHRIKYITNS